MASRLGAALAALVVFVAVFLIFVLALGSAMGEIEVAVATVFALGAAVATWRVRLRQR